MKRSVLSLIPFIIAFLAFHPCSHATERDKLDRPQKSHAQDSSTTTLSSTRPRPLNLMGFPALDSSHAIPTRKGSYGYQMVTFGALQHHIINAVQAKTSNTKRQLKYAELAAGHGLLPLLVFEHTSSDIGFFVNDLYAENLSDLSKLMARPNNSTLKKTFKLNEGDAIAALDGNEIRTFAPGGIHFLSALNVIHYWKPLKIIQLFARASTTLANGGEFYIMHDSGIPEDSMMLLQSLYSQINENLYRSAPDMFTQNIGMFQTMPGGIQSLMIMLKAKCREELEKNYFEFPSYSNQGMVDTLSPFKNQGQVDGTDLHCFNPTSEFIESLASAVGLRLIKKGGIRGLTTTCMDCPINEASSIWYAFVKDGGDPLHTPGPFHFSHSKNFKELMQRAILAEQQRKNLKFEPLIWFPFIKPLPIIHRLNNIILRTETTLPVIDLLSLHTLPNYTDHELRKEIQKADITPFAKIKLPGLVIKKPLKRNLV